MPDFGVVVTFLIFYFSPGEDYPSATWKERMSSPVRCIAAVTQGILAESQRHGIIRNGGTMTFGCQIDMPEAKEH